MRVRSFRSILDECLTALQRGESLDACLSRYPRQADRLRPLLSISERVRRVPPAAPRPLTQGISWDRVRQRAAELRSNRRTARATVNHGAWLRPLAITMALLVAIGAGTSATAIAAQDSLPDSRLYPVKLATEDARVWFTFDSTHKAEILLDQSNERTQEITTMVGQGKQVPSNVLSALRDRNDRAFGILNDHPGNNDVLNRARLEAETQEKLLIALWPDVEDSARTEYTRAVADVHNSRRPSTDVVEAVQPEELSGGVLNISGVAQKVSDGVWNVGGSEVRVDEKTFGSEQLEAGATANFVVARSASGRLHALSLSTVKKDTPPTEALVSGEVEEVEKDRIRVAGQWIPVNQDTLFKLQIGKGKKVQVTLGNTGSGIVASTISAAPAAAAPDESNSVTYEGAVSGDGQAGDKEWTIGGLTFEISPTTRIDTNGGAAANGARAQVEATATSDGKLQADTITILAADSPADSMHLIGTYQGSRGNSWIVGTLEVQAKHGLKEPAKGSLISLDGTEANGNLSAISVAVIQTLDESGLGKITGTIISIDGSVWTMDAEKVRVVSTVPRSGNPVAGARAIVWGRNGDDGIFKAAYARVLDQKPVVTLPTPTPEPEATP